MVWDKPELRVSIVTFINLQHRVTVDGNLGPLHKHSCSIEVEITPPHENIIPFAEIESEVRAQVMPFDGKTLNDMANFRDINPTIENLGCHLYNRLTVILAEYGAVLHSVTVNESPTRSVKLINPLSGSRQGAPDGVMAPPSNESRAPFGNLPASPNQRAAYEFGDPVPIISGTRPGESSSLDGRGQIPPNQGNDKASSSDYRGGNPEVATPLPGPPAAPVDVPAHEKPEPSLEPVAPVEAPALIYDSLPSRRRRKENPASRPIGDEVVHGSARTARSTIIAVVLLMAVCALVYRNVLWPPSHAGYPWGSDTWGHIAKAEFLLREISRGNLYPRFNPAWYNGVEPFRYWAPAPYYVLAALMRVVRDPFRAAGWFVALCALVGALGWLPHRRRLGLAAAVAASALWMIWPDHIRVAMSEGNLPRAMATALFPWALHWFVMVVERRDWPISGLAMTLTAAFLILTHAMIAAACFAEMTLLAVLWGLLGGIRARSVARGVGTIFAGIGTAAWWLLPALKGGITSINVEAVTETMDYFPLTTSFNPVLRMTNPEVFYWGIVLLPVSLWVLFTWHKRSSLARASFLAGAVLVAITTTTLRPFYNSIPLHHLLWPLYMASGASAMFFLAGLDPVTFEPGRPRRLATAVLVALLTFYLADAYPSFKLIDTRPMPLHIEKTAREIPKDGWRIATLDLSGFGSVGTYMFGDGSRREQVFGWAWQGANTASSIVWLNTALKEGRTTFLFDRLKEIGATSLVVRRQVVEHNLEDFLRSASVAGYRESWCSPEVILLTRDSGPYALNDPYQALGIGRFVPNLAMMFPAVEVGTSNQVDIYTIEYLQRYRVVVLSGATWANKARAEDLLMAYARGGGRLVIDMQDLPEDVLSRRPSVLGVTGEPVLLYRRVEVLEDGRPVMELRNFDDAHYPWKALSPQGLDHMILYFDHFQENAALLGTKKVDGGEAWFIGANLPFHAYLTGDPAALYVLSQALTLQLYAPPERRQIPLEGYVADADGYRFSLMVPQEWGESRVLIPVATRENTELIVDGVPASSESIHNLLAVRVTPGRHTVSARTTIPTPSRAGILVSIVSLICFGVVTSLPRRGVGREVVSTTGATHSTAD